MKLKFKDKQEFEEFKALFDCDYIFPDKNPTERLINDIKHAFRRHMLCTISRRRLWIRSALY